MRTVAFVPAMGKDRKEFKKNTAILDGEPLFKRKVRQLLDCPAIDEVYLDTESDQLVDMVSDMPVKILKRDPALSSRSTDGHMLFAHEAAATDAGLYIQCLCTSP